MLKKSSEDIIHRNSFWTYKHDVFQYPDGRTGDYYYGEDRGMAIVVPILPDGRLVLGKQHRYLVDQMSIEFPGGGIRSEETPDQAARRELFEEVGYTATYLEQIGKFQQYIGVFKAPAYVYVAKVTTPDKQILDDTEDITVITATPQEFSQMIQRGEVIDGGTLAAWAMAFNLVT
ncbi:MAG: ADP-ribose pyrophosphatase [uncultured bacterium]|nr:MAG: ADP-ribose pyrophosphatase [uncultured bacterium]